ncbi:hypothetical protein OPQ81_008443 [Rhizoctonia solani]|nr:hypothetical protein OPQ81_008443 [Rhizoctonia solani]
MERLKDLVADTPCLAPLDFETESETILAVDSSNIAIGFVLYQVDGEDQRRPIRFGSMTFNDHESRYSQPKLELYGLYRALRKWRTYLVSVRNLVVEVDALSVRGMLNSPELVTNATVGRWVEEISTYAFKLQHVRAPQHTVPNGLSRRPRAPEDTESSESE